MCADGWKNVTLAEIVADFVNGGTPSTRVAEYWSGDIPWITGADIKNFRVAQGRKCINEKALKNSAVHLVPENTVLLVTRTSVGKVGVSVNPICFSQDITAIICKPSVRPEYLARYLASIPEMLVSRVRGSTIKGLIREDLMSIEVPLPPIETQERIITILNRAQALIEKRHQSNQLTDSMIKCVFLKMFGDPATNPSGWPEVTIKDVAVSDKRSIRTGPFGSQLKKSELVETGISVFGIENVVDDEFHPDTRKFISEEKYRQLSGFAVKPGDVLVSRMGTVGRTAVVPENLGKAIISYHLIRIEVDRSRCHPVFLKHMILSDYVQRQISAASHGAIMGGLTTQIIKDTRIYLPPLDAQNKFISAVLRVGSMRKRQKASTQEISELFHSLMHKAFRGELATAKIAA
jgi:type I restriction enzyme S subunit